MKLTSYENYSSETKLLLMSSTISNPSGDRNDKIANAAKVIGNSKQTEAVFKAIYTNKKKIKTVRDIIISTGIESNVRVLQIGKKLYAEDMINIINFNKRTAYEKIDFYTHNIKKIIQLSNDKKKLNKFPTKTNPQTQSHSIKISFPKKIINIKEIMIDDFENFSKIKKIKIAPSIFKPLEENKIKLGFQKLMNEKGKFTDWGGEINDLFTSRIILKGKRRTVAFAFKGKATKGILTPKKLGRNGDQIQRLFKSPCEIFIIQYQGQVDPSVYEQMRIFAIAKSVTDGTKIYYGVVDGQDTSRLLQAYPTKFK